MSPSGDVREIPQEQMGCHSGLPSIFSLHCSRLERAPTEPSLALLCMFLAEIWRSLRMVFLKKMLRNIVSRNLSITFTVTFKPPFALGG